MSSPGSVGSFEPAVEPSHTQYDPDDDRWRDQAVDVETIRKIAKAAVDRMGGTAWSAGTEPS